MKPADKRNLMIGRSESSAADLPTDVRAELDSRLERIGRARLGDPSPHRRATNFNPRPTLRIERRMLKMLTS